MNKNIKIPVISAIIVIALLVVVFLQHKKIQKVTNESTVRIEQIQADYQKEKDRVAVKDKVIEDTVRYYKKLKVQSEEEITSYKVRYSDLKKRLADIQDVEADSKKAYTVVRSYLPNSTDEESWAFSGNQVQQMHKDYLTLEELKPLPSFIEEMSSVYDAALKYRDEWIDVLYDRQVELEGLISAGEEAQDKLVKENKKLIKQNKNSNTWNKVFAVSAGVAVVVALLK